MRLSFADTNKLKPTTLKGYFDLVDTEVSVSEWQNEWVSE